MLNELEIKTLISQNRLEEALNAISTEAYRISDNDLINEVILKKNQLERLNQLSRHDTLDSMQLFKEYNGVTLSLLLMVDMLSKQQKKMTDGKDENDNKKEVINEFSLIYQKNIEFYKTTQEKLEVLFNQNAILFENTFGIFLDKLNDIPSVNNKTAGVLFNRLAGFDKLLEFDKIFVSSVRTSQNFSWQDRHLIVSALTISLFRKFDRIKFNYLLDFLLDFETKVWQQALIGIVFGLQSIKDVNLDKKMLSKLSLIREMPIIQNSLFYIFILINLRAYDRKEMLSKLKNNNSYEGVLFLLKKIRNALPEINYIGNKSMFYGLYDLIFNIDKADEIEDIYDELQFNFSNPYNIDYSDFFKLPSHWFLIFDEKSPIIEKIIENTNVAFDLRELAENLTKSFLFSEKDKFMIFVSVEMLTIEDLKFVNSLSKIDINILQTDIHSFFGFNIKEFQYFYHSISGYTDFFEYSAKLPINPILAHNLAIEQTSNLELISNQSKQYEIEGNQKYLEGNYSDALNLYLKALGLNEANYQIIRKIGDCLFLDKKFEQALEIYSLIPEGTIVEFSFYKNIGICLVHLEDYKKAFYYLVKAENYEQSNETIRYMIAICYSSFGTYWKSILYLENLYNENPSDDLVLFSLISNLIQNKDSYKSIFYGKIFLLKYPKSKWIFNQLVRSISI